jgi:hypothetical protein
VGETGMARVFAVMAQNWLSSTRIAVRSWLSLQSLSLSIYFVKSTCV